MNFPKKQAQRLMPLYLLEYSEKLFTNHPDPSAPWGGGGGGSDYTAGEGITITNNVISVDDTIAKKSEIPTNYVTLDTDQTITGYKTFSTGFKVGNTTENEIVVGNSGWGISMTRNGIVDEFGAMVTKNDGAYFNYFKYPDSESSNVTVHNTYILPHQDATGENTYTLATTNDIPTPPTVNNPTIRFTQGGVTKGTITLNQSNDQTIAFDDGAQPDCPFLNVSDPRSQMLFSLDGSEFSFYKFADLSSVEHQFYVNLSALNPVFKDGLTSTYNQQTNQLEVGLSAPIPTVNNPTITFTQGGITKGEFSLNQATNQTIDLDAGGSSYTFTNGLTENGGTVSSELYDLLTIDSDKTYLKLGNRNVVPSETVSLKAKRGGELQIFPGWNTAYAVNIYTTSDAPSVDQHCIYAQLDNALNLGKPDKRIKDIYVMGNISDGTNSVTVADIATKSEIPTTATSTLTPTTTQLVFTYADNTTETITLMTAATVTTTLS